MEWNVWQVIKIQVLLIFPTLRVKDAHDLWNVHVHEHVTHVTSTAKTAPAQYFWWAHAQVLAWLICCHKQNCRVSKLKMVMKLKYNLLAFLLHVTVTTPRENTSMECLFVSQTCQFLTSESIFWGQQMWSNICAMYTSMHL